MLPMEQGENLVMPWAVEGFMMNCSPASHWPLLSGQHCCELTVLASPQEREVLVHWEGAPGTSRPAMQRITAQVSEELRDLPGVRSVGAHVGRAVTSDQVTGISSAELWIGLDSTVT